MSGPKKRKYTTRDNASPDTHTTVKIVVRENRDGTLFEVEDADVEVVDAGANAKGTTNSSGVFAPKGLVRAGKYDVRVTKTRYGPPQTGGTPVAEGPIVKNVELLPNSKLPAGESTNVVAIEIMLEHPRIRVEVLEDKGILGQVALKGADIEIIGLTKGTSDKNGRFVSPYAKFGTWKVHVKKDGMFPQNQDGSAFFREVELRAAGFAPGGGFDRDVHLQVVLGASAPSDIPPNTPNPVAVWASGGHTPHTVLEDPRLPADEPKGQGGWDMGINYGNFFGLAVALGRERPSHLGGGDIGKHAVSRLAIVAHGMPGVIDVDQTESTAAFGTPKPTASRCLTPDRIAAYHTEIDKIGEALRQNSVVIFASCQAAEGAQGEELLKMLSRRWKTTTVVGVRTIATTVDGMIKPGENAMFAGVRDTRYSNGNKKPGEQRDYEKTEFVQNLKKLPWVSESSPHATVARDGNIIRRGARPT